MPILSCKRCGGDLNLIEGSSTAECEYCGVVQTVPKADDEKKLNLFARANRLRASCDFDKAAGIYESIIADFPEEAEAYWGLVLCQYGIEYVDDPGTGKKIPTCHRSGFESVLKDPNYELAAENADILARRLYREEAKAIEELRKSIIAVSSKEEPYDIFICYKETSETGERTLDSVLAQDVYKALTESGYRVFFSRISLEDKLGLAYEPYIFAALNSAKIMLAFGTDYEYFNAVWVKNEWSRYLKLMANDSSKHLIPCYKGIDAYDMPEEFARLQAQDLGKVGAVQDLLRGIEKLLPKKEKTETVIVQQTPNSPGVESLLRRAALFLEDKDWNSANEYFDKVLDIQPECADAYVGKLCAERHYTSIAVMARDARYGIAHSGNYVKAMRFGSPQLQEQLKTYLAEADKAYRAEQQKMAYEKACADMEASTTPEDCEATAKLFRNMGNYADAPQRAEACLKKAEEIRQKRREKIEADRKQREEKRAADYAEAVSELEKAESPEECDQLAKRFELFGDYQDSQQQKQIAIKKAIKMRKALEEEAERQRIEAQKQREELEAALALQKAKRRRKRRLIFLGIVVGIFLIGLIGKQIAYVQDYKYIYEQALEDYQEEKYEDAYDKFEQIILETNFKKISGIADADERLADCIHAEIAKWDYTWYTFTNKLHDRCAQWSADKKPILDQCLMTAAQELFKAGDYGPSAVLYSFVTTNASAKQDMQKSHYYYAEQLLAEGNLSSAASHFKSAGDYSDAAQRAIDTTYAYGVEKFEAGVYGTAYNILSELGDYKDSAVMMKYCQMISLAMEDVLSAEELLNQLPEDYKNVAEIKQYLATVKPFLGTYTCTAFDSSIYEDGKDKTTQSNKPHQYYYSLNIKFKYVRKDDDSTTFTPTVVLEACNKNGATKNTWTMTSLSLFNSSSFQCSIDVRTYGGQLEEWVVLKFSHNKVTMDEYEDTTHTTFVSISNYVFEKQQ